MNLKSAVVVVTGGATGVGRALALYAGKAGAKVAVTDINSPDETVNLITADGGQAQGYVCDVRSTSALADLAATIHTDLGRVNLVCANAGSSTGFGTIDSATLDDFRSTFELNVFGVFNTISAFLDQLKNSASDGNTAAIMITGSEHSLGIPSTSPPLLAYTSSKHALVGLAGCCRRDLSGTGVTVSLLCPGWVKTETLTGFASKNEPLATRLAQYGQKPAEVAKLAFEGLATGKLYIPTNPTSREDGLNEHLEILEAVSALPSE